MWFRGTWSSVMVLRLLLLVGLLMSTETAWSTELLGMTEYNELAWVDCEPTGNGLDLLMSVKPFGANCTEIVTAQQLSVLDRTSGILYFYGFDDANSAHVIGLDVNNEGNIVSDVIVPDVIPSVFVGVGDSIDLDTTNNALIVTGFVQANGGTHLVLSIDIATGGITKLAEVPTPTSTTLEVIGMIHGIDPTRQTLWLEYSDRATNIIQMYSVDLKTGESAMRGNNTVTMETCTWDDTTNSFVGIGLEMSTFTRSVVRFTPTNSGAPKFEVIGDLDTKEVIIDGGIAAFNQDTRGLSVLLQADIGNQALGFMCLTVDVDTAAIKRQVYAGAINNLPFHMHRYK